MQPCLDRRTGRPVAPLVWSRRNGAWRRVAILWVGAAPGNAGGRGAGELGAHGTRIPFGGDIAGANLDVLLASIGLDRNDTFIVASLNRLPARGGGEPTAAEIAEPVGRYPDSIALLRDTLISAGPELVVALGNVAIRATAAAVTLPYAAAVGQPVPRTGPPRMPGLQRIAAAGIRRGTALPWPADAFPFDRGLAAAWQDAWREPPAFHVLQLVHPSAQNMSPYAGVDTAFHHRMLDARAALHDAVRNVLHVEPPAMRPPVGGRGGVYALPEWRDRIGERLHRLDELWRAKGV